MGLENPLHILILLVFVLLLFGAKRLPEAGRNLGTSMRNFKDALVGEDRSEVVDASSLRPSPDEIAAKHADGINH